MDVTKHGSAFHVMCVRCEYEWRLRRIFVDGTQVLLFMMRLKSGCLLALRSFGSLYDRRMRACGWQPHIWL